VITAISVEEIDLMVNLDVNLVECSLRLLNKTLMTFKSSNMGEMLFKYGKKRAIYPDDWFCND